MSDGAARILVVDDNPNNLLLMEAQLRRAGYSVVTETSGRAALEAARERPDLIFLDVMMPGLDGYETCRRLKADPATRAIPVVMLTSLRERADKIRALEAGADDFLSKPIDSAEIAARVRSLLRLRHLDDDLARSREEIAAQAEQLAAEKGRAEAILYSIGDGVFTTDPDGRVTMLNPAAERVTGTTVEQALGRDWREAFRVRSATGRPPSDELCPVRGAMRSGQPVDAQNLVLHRPGAGDATVNLVAAAVTHGGGQPTGVVGVFRDVTRERELDRMKRELVSLVSHELRGPASVIYGFAELLLTRERLSPDGRRFTETIFKETERLSNLIRDFLDVEQLENGSIRYDLKPVAVQEVVVELRAALAAQLSRHRVVLDFPTEPIVVVADRARLAQVLDNLIGNAIKYSPTGGDVRVRARADDGRATIAVADGGVGLPAEAFDRLFEKFYRVDDAHHRPITGIGLGLAICRRLVAGMGGEIWAESAGPGEGSTFSFTLPVAPGAGTTEARVDEAGADSSPAPAPALWPNS